MCYITSIKLFLKKNYPYRKNDKTKEFYTKVWDVVKEPLCASIQLSFIAGELSTSQKQAIIKLVEKKIEIKDLLKTGDLYHF